MTHPVAVGFDFDHTLGLDHGLERRAFVLLAEALGSPIALQDKPEAARLDALLVRFRHAELTLDETVAAFVAGLHRPPAPDAAHGAHYRELCYRLVDELVEPLPGAPELLAELADSGVATAILTNGWSPLQEKKIARALGHFPGAVLVSDTLGVLKPKDAAFEQLCSALGRPRAEVWYVGDNPVIDIAGARAAGLRAAWFDWEGQGYPDGLEAPHARIHALLDLLPIVRGS